MGLVCVLHGLRAVAALKLHPGIEALPYAFVLHGLRAVAALKRLAGLYLGIGVYGSSPRPSGCGRIEAASTRFQ